MSFDPDPQYAPGGLSHIGLWSRHMRRDTAEAEARSVEGAFVLTWVGDGRGDVIEERVLPASPFAGG